MGRLVLHLFGYAATVALVAAFLTRQVKPIDTLDWIRWVFLIAFAPALLRYLLQLVVAPWYELVMSRRQRRLRERGLAANQPLVSVLVPAWNEEVGIASTVESVLANDYPRLEVIVVDDGSTDGTARVMEGLVAEQKALGAGADLLFQSVPNGGKSAALNTALGLARGDIIVTIDADSVMDPDAIAAFVQSFDDPDVMCVAGNVKVGNHETAVGLVQHFEYLFSFFFKKADSLLNAVYIVGGAAASYRRWVFDKLGGFDPTIITEDIELSTRIQDHGWAVRYAPKAVIWTEGAPTFLGLARQRVRWKYGRLVTFWRYRHLFFSLNRRHSKFLSLLVLPVALLADVLLLLQPIVLTTLIAYSVAADDYLLLLVYAALMTVLLVIQVLTDVRRSRHLHLLLLAPAAWIVVYIVDLIELQALVRSMARLASGREVRWQRWQRAGVFSVGPQPRTELEATSPAGEAGQPPSAGVVARPAQPAED